MRSAIARWCLWATLVGSAGSLRAQGGDTVRIRVVDSEGAPVPQAVVALWQGSRERATGLTSGSGRVGLMLTAAPSGLRTIVVRAVGFDPASRLLPRSEAEIVFRLERRIASDRITILPGITAHGTAPDAAIFRGIEFRDP